jgi:hypothetical protein
MVYISFRRRRYWSSHDESLKKAFPSTVIGQHLGNNDDDEMAWFQYADLSSVCFDRKLYEHSDASLLVSN